MNNCKILIADDEELARHAIKLILNQFADLHIIESSNGKETVERIIEFNPDIIFLDIQMPLLNGLEVLEKISSNYHPAVIITTAFDEYALQAFDKDAIDYLLKPFTEKRFLRAFDKAYQSWKVKKLTPFFTGEVESSFSLFLKQVYLNLEPQITITVKDSSKIYLIQLSDIHFVEAGKDYQTIITQERKYLFKGKLFELQKQLPSQKFVRTHKSFIVNTLFIKELHSQNNGDYSILLKNGATLKLSRNYRDTVLKILNNKN